MQKEIKLFLLKIVKSNGSIAPIVNMGYQFTQIIDFLDMLTSEGLVMRIGAKFSITEEGKKAIDELNKNFHRENAALWIEPAVEHRVLKIEPDDVFLPNQDDLSF